MSGDAGPAGTTTTDPVGAVATSRVAAPGAGEESAGRAAALADLPLRDVLRGVEPYGAPQLDVPVLLNVNENPVPPSEAVAREMGEAVAAAARGLNRYPDREFLDLRADLADFLALESGVRLPAEQLWAANGSNEVMLQVLQAFGGEGRTAVSFAPTYSMYPEYARDTGTRWVVGRRRDDFTVDPVAAVALVQREQPSVVLLASPNNPTGTALPREVVEAVCDVAPGVVVVDEAYAEFRREGVPSALELLERYPRLAVSRTMSKAFSLAGARVGYLASSRAVVDALRVVRLPYHLSGVTQAVARVALRHAAELLRGVDALRAERDDLVAWLRGLGLEVADSDANFVLFGRLADRHAAWQGLLDRGVLVRETGPDGWLRVSVGTPEETAAFESALVEVLATPAGARADHTPEGAR